MKIFELSFDKFYFTQNFWKSIFQISRSLTIIKLEMDYIDINVIQDNLDSLKSRFGNVLFLELICQNKEADINFIKKNFRE